MEKKNKFGFFKRIKYACTEPLFYKQVADESGKKTALYLIKLLLFLFVIQAPFIFYTGWNASSEIANNLQKNLPRIVFQNGNLEVEAKTPLKIPVYEKYKMLIDPQGTIPRKRLEPNVLIVISNKVIFIRSNKEFRSVYTNFYSKEETAPEIVIDSEFLSSWLPRLRAIMSITTIFALLMSLITLTVLRLVLLTIAGLIARSRHEKSFSWNQLLSISVYVLTPIFLVETPLLIAGLTFPHFDFFLLLGGALWLFYIINTLANTDNNNQHKNGRILDKEA
jgi:hypothetical protein